MAEIADSFFAGVGWNAGKYLLLVLAAVVLGKWKPWRWLPRVIGRG